MKLTNNKVIDFGMKHIEADRITVIVRIRPKYERLFKIIDRTRKPRVKKKLIKRVARDGGDLTMYVVKRAFPNWKI